MNQELPDVQAGFRKCRGMRDQIANMQLKSKGIPEKNVLFCFIAYTKAFDCADHKKMWKILKEMGIPDHFACLLSIQVKKQQLALNLEQWTGSKVGKACVKIVYRHPVYLTFMQSTS